MLKIGYMKFINIFPLFWHLEQEPEYTFVYGVPSDLNRALHEEGVDVSPVSSLEYMNRPERYKIFGGIGICAEKKVKSVLLQSDCPIEELDGKHIYLTSQSLTSVCLLRLILDKFYNVAPEYVDRDQPRNAYLLIGDKALKSYYERGSRYSYDLADLWYKHTGLPFVFSLWLASAGAADKPEIKKLYENLLRISSTVHEKVDFYADQYLSRDTSFSKTQLTDYWRTLYFTMGEREIKGLDLYYKMLGYEPQWHYYDSSQTGGIQ